MSKQSGDPEYDRVKIGKRYYRRVHLLVHTRRYDTKQTPALVTLIKPDQVLDIHGGESFVEAYIPERYLGEEDGSGSKD